MNPESKTPRTDAARKTYRTSSGQDWDYVLPEDMAEIETELTEAKAQLDEANADAERLANAERCRNCDDVGWFTEWRRTVSGDPEPEQCQCEFCETNPKSMFKAIAAHEARLKGKQ